MLMFGLTGCGYFQQASNDDDMDLTEIEDSDKPEKGDFASNVLSQEFSSEPAEGELELKLKIGDRFPLRKTVEHRLTQTDKSGTTVSTSRTEMLLTLVVEDVLADGRKQMAVRYHRVRHEQDVGGRRVAYSSERATDPVPPEAMLYAGLANNGFSFWVGANNKVSDIVGFNDFLKRCLRNIPAQHATSVQQQLETTRSEEGIANFIDDSIGLLPYSTDPSHPAVAVKEGSYWDLEPRRSDAPIPMLVTTRCMLKELSATTAEIMLTGNITGPKNPVTMRSADGDMKVLVKGGQCNGSCRVDRKTGLPTQSQVQRYFELAMEMPNGQRVQQNKETMSTITSYLDQSQQADASASQRVQPASFQNAVGTESHRKVIPAVGSRTHVNAER